MASNTFRKIKFQSKFSNQQKLWFLFKIVIVTGSWVLAENNLHIKVKGWVQTKN